MSEIEFAVAMLPLVACLDSQIGSLMVVLVHK